MQNEGQTNEFTQHRLSKHPTLKPYPEDDDIFLIHDNFKKQGDTVEVQLFFLQWKTAFSSFYDVK